MIIKLPGPRNSTLLDPSGTKTFRLASRMLFDTYGSNLQNINKAMRRIYVADPGYTLIQIDQSGAEALIVAYLCQHGRYRELFIHGVKPHVFIALHVFADVWSQYFPAATEQALKAEVKDLTKIPEWKQLDSLIKASDDWPNEKYPKGTRYYYIGKKLCHSSNYKQGPGRFMLTVLEETDGKVVLTKKQSSTYLEHYHELFPEIRGWHIKTEALLKKDGMLRNLFGYPKINTKDGEISDKEMREWISFVPQSTVATITNKALAKSQDFIEDHDVDWHLLATTHDSIMFETPDSEVDLGVKTFMPFMTPELVAPDGTKFKMKAEAQTGKNWCPWKKDKNSEGLREYAA